MLVGLSLLTVCLIASFVQEAAAVYCLQCSGWYGSYPSDDTTSTCDSSNNACSSANFCVRIVDPIFKYRHYKTYKADCYTSTTFASASSTYTIENGKCYNYTDGGTPPKTYYYCFCNDRDYCNSARQHEPIFAAILSLISLGSLSFVKSRL